MKFIAYLKAHSTMVGIIATLVVVVGGYSFFASNRPANYQTVTVKVGPFAQHIAISGKVVPTQDVDLGFTQSGRVAHVYASVGQHVASGSLLATLDNGDLAANLAQKQANLQVQQAKLESLKAGTRPEEIAVAQAAVDSDQVALTQANAAIANAIQDAYTRADDAVRNQTYQFVSNPRGISPTVIFLVNDSQSESSFEGAISGVEHALVSWQSAIAIGAYDSASVSLAQSNLASVRDLLTKASTVLTHSIPSGSVTAASIASYTADINTARSSINTAITNLTSAVTAQKNAAAALAQAQANLDLQKAGTQQSDIDAQAAQVAAAEADVANAQAQLGKTTIVAPFSGVITNVDAKVGVIASPNTALISMIGSGTFQIETYIPEVSISGLNVGDTATVTLDAYGTSVPFDANVVSIDPAETTRDGVSTYKTTLQFTQNDTRIRSGMTADVEITTEEKQNVLAVPQGALYTKNGKQYLQILEEGKPKEMEVTSGSLSSIGNVAITSGLTDGATVILNPTH